MGNIMSGKSRAKKEASAKAILNKMAEDGFNATTDMPACFLRQGHPHRPRQPGLGHINRPDHRPQLQRVRPLAMAADPDDPAISRDERMDVAGGRAARVRMGPAKPPPGPRCARPRA